jgi:hypothetical protein
VGFAAGNLQSAPSMQPLWCQHDEPQPDSGPVDIREGGRGGRGRGRDHRWYDGVRRGIWWRREYASTREESYTMTFCPRPTASSMNVKTPEVKASTQQRKRERERDKDKEERERGGALPRTLSSLWSTCAFQLLI